MRHKALKMMILLVTLLAIGLPSKSDNCILSSPVKIIVYPSKNIKGDRVSRPEYLSGFRQRDFRPVVIQSSDSVSRLMKLLDTLEQAGKAPLNSKSDGNFLTIDSTGFHWNAVKEKIEYLIIILTDKDSRYRTSWNIDDEYIWVTDGCVTRRDTRFVLSPELSRFLLHVRTASADK